MDKIWMRKKIHKCFLLVLSRPFMVLILLIVVMSTILHVTSPCLVIVVCSIATAACLALGTGEFLSSASRTVEPLSRTGELQARTEEFQSDLSSAFWHMHAQPNFDGALAPQTTRWKQRFAQLLGQAFRSSLVPVKMCLLSNFKEADGYGEGVEQTIASSRVVEIEQGQRNGLLDAADACGNDESIVCTHTAPRMVVANCKAQPSCGSVTQYEGEVGDVPELEDCTTSSEEEEEVCKQVLETFEHMSGPLSDGMATDAILQPTNTCKAAMVSPSEDEHSIDKYQILPLEVCMECNNAHHQHTDVHHNDKGAHRQDMDADDSPSGRVCDAIMDRKKFEITDAELQNAANEFYTLEGDVLWGERGMKSQAGAPAVQSTCNYYKQEGKLSQSFSIFPLKTRTEARTFACKPASSKLVYYVDAKRNHQQESQSEQTACASAEELNEDVMLDQELRAIASRSGNKGESSNYMSTAGSFRDYVGSFREFDTYWPDYDIAERREEEYFSGCCDDHTKPCISHSKSRSKVLQTDPLLSKASLLREQEIMDVLWQEYNEDRRQKHYNLGKDIAQKQRSRLAVDGNGSTVSEVLNEGSTAESFNVMQNGYVMKLKGAAEAVDGDASSCRLGCDKPCWTKARSYQRRRHLVGLCRVFRELGLKQCMQSSKVDK